MQLESISQLYSIFKQHPVVSTDSRNHQEGALFFSLKGENFNANAYALSALENGAKYAVIDEEEYELDNRFILVNNVLETLQQLATFHRRQLGTTIIGITGTNGKTTTKELIAAVLKEKYNILYTQGNLNNHIGVPLTLLKLKPEHDIAVVEMGANHPGEIAELSEIARPQYGIITNVGKAHLEGFGSFEGIMSTKAELYKFIAEKGKLVFMNTDNTYLWEMAQDAGLLEKNKRIVEYKVGIAENENIISGQIIDSTPFLKMKCDINGDVFEVSTRLIGTYNAENVLAAATIGSFFKISCEAIKHGLESYEPQNNRSQFVETENNKLIIDAYNANPSSMALSIRNFADINAAHKLLILGDMLELGEQSKAEHTEIISLLQSYNLKEALLVGNEFKEVNTSYPQFDNVEKLIEYLEKNPVKDHTILIKGSRGIKLEKTIEKL